MTMPWIDFVDWLGSYCGRELFFVFSFVAWPFCTRCMRLVYFSVLFFFFCVYTYFIAYRFFSFNTDSIAFKDMATISFMIYFLIRKNIITA